MVTEAVAKEQGTVDKFIGDAVMAFWGAPVELENHALSACRSALRILRGMERLNQTWVEQGKPAMGIRIGVNTAEVLVGNIGSDDRLSYTAIGDGVNVASRLQSVNKQFGSRICISDSVYEAVSSGVIAKPLGDVKVKGRRTEFPIYELLEIRGAEDPDLVSSEPKPVVRSSIMEQA
jgi:class 3 adenylate cyclase